MPSKMKVQEADLKLKELVRSERKITAEIISVISEIDRRRLFLGMGHSSLFSYLTEEIGYSPSAAQRRIEAARISRQVPGISERLQTGAINLSMLALTSQALREKSKTCTITSELKTDLIAKIENKNTKQTQVILAQTLDLPVINFEKSKVQRDNSVRIELTLNKIQNEKLQSAKELASHIKPNANMAELIEHLTDFYLQKKRPGSTVPKRTSEAEVGNKMPSEKRPVVVKEKSGVQTSRYIPQVLRRKIFERDQFCQWRPAGSKKICASKHQLEIHHQKPVWAGGSSNQENLQLLCRAHNAYTYRNEAQIKLL